MSENTCVLCKEPHTADEEPNNFTQCSNTPFREILENVLDHYIPILNSDLHLCESCMELMNELDMADSTYKSIKLKIVNYCVGFEVQAKRLDASSQTESKELSDIKKSTHEISDNVEFEFVDTNYFAECEVKIDTTEDFTCYICNASFTTENKMIVHFKSLHHITIKKATESEQKFNMRTKTTAVNNKITIKRAGRALKKPIVVGEVKLSDYLGDENGSLRNSVRLSVAKVKKKKLKLKVTSKGIKPIIINNTNINESISNIKESIKLQAKPKVPPAFYKCEVCLKRWTSQYRFNNHSCGAAIEEPYICERCGQVFKQKSVLTSHISAHDGIFPYTCSFCSKRFLKKASLQRHLPIHTGEVQYQCELCGKSFIHTSSFSTHMRLHAGQKNFKCSQCGLAVFSRPHLERHMRVHTGEKPYPCTLCPKRFAERYNLYTHLKVHRKQLELTHIKFEDDYY